MNVLKSSADISIELAPTENEPFEEHKTDTDNPRKVVSFNDIKSLFLCSGILYAFMVLKQLRVNFFGTMSKITGRFANFKVPKVILTPLLKLYSALYGVNLEETEIRRLRDYDSFNSFFTRKLRAGIRQIEDENDPKSICSP